MQYSVYDKNEYDLLGDLNEIIYDAILTIRFYDNYGVLLRTSKTFVCPKEGEYFSHNKQVFEIVKIIHDHDEKVGNIIRIIGDRAVQD